MKNGRNLLMLAHPLSVTLYAVVTISQPVFARGVMEDPPARNWLCGVVTKPDEVLYGNPEFPICRAALAPDQHAGYSFMSVQTHDRGRAFVQPLPENVCGFNSENFNNGPTPWDTVMDWPPTPFAAGRQEIKWNIQWGPHFSDTEEFRYWITKPEFQFDSKKALKWSDFESEEFCVVKYDDKIPYANKDVVPLKNSAQFRTFCDVPERQGHHVIYGEWGRSQATLERVHGCIDVAFDSVNLPAEEISRAGTNSTQSNDSVIGSDPVTPDAPDSNRQNVSYRWTVETADPNF